MKDDFIGGAEIDISNWLAKAYRKDTHNIMLKLKDNSLSGTLIV